MKHITVELEQELRERIAQHNDNLYGWMEGGWLTPTEPDHEERNKTVAGLLGARYELIRLLVKWCGADEELLMRLTIAASDGEGIVSIGPKSRITQRYC